MADATEDEVDNTDLIPDPEDRPIATQKAGEVQPPYQIYAGSKLPVGRAVGPMFKKRLDGALKAYEAVHIVWELCYQYYNFDQTRSLETPLGTFKRGDSSENVIHSNINITLPAVYSKNPDVSCSTSDGQDEPFCQAMQSLLNALLRRRDQLNAKPRVKRCTGLALLTNHGVLKIDFTKKDDSRETAIAEMQKLSDELQTVKKQEDADALWGKYEALERNMEVRRPNGFTLSTVMPQNLIVDPHAEEPDGSDAEWMMERVNILTSELIERFTREDDERGRVLLYKPTHKAVFTRGEGSSDDAMGMVLSALSDSESTSAVRSYTSDERLAYLDQYYTECYYVWDKAFRRIYLFHRDDWTWPIWVWDDTLNTTVFFPYFFIMFSFSTGGMLSVGDIAFVLDQQDHINDINRQAANIRRAVFDYWFYNAEKFDQQEIEKVIDAIRGKIKLDKHAIGVKDLGDGEKVKDMIESISPPSINYKELFDKEPLIEGINRQTNTSDALRGVQFKTNTNVEAVNTYQQSMQLSIGAKVDVVEDAMTNLCYSVAEIAVQNWDTETVAGFIGEELAKGWQEMDIETFRSTYSVEITPGSTEKPTSVFKKKEALEIAQAVGQFAQAAPGATLSIMLRVLSKAFTDVVIKPEDWNALGQEIQAQLNRGDSTGGANAGPGGSPGGGEGDMRAQIDALPDPIKQQIGKAIQGGASDQQVMQLIQQAVGQQQGATTNGTATRRQ